MESFRERFLGHQLPGFDRKTSVLVQAGRGVVVAGPHLPAVDQKGCIPLAALGIGALAALPALIHAADEQTSQTYVCHAVVAGESANARMTVSSNAALTCRPINIALKMSNGSMRTIGHVGSKMTKGPDYSSALTPAQINDAWVKFIETAFSVNHSP